MLTSLEWLNRYLDPARPVGLDEAVELLEAYSFPIESVEDVPGGDHCLDVELTSNRGDCFSHLSLAKETAASSGRSVVPPPAWEPGRAPAVNGQPLAGSFTIENAVPTLCPRFTGRIIRGVKVGPSPDWLRALLEAVGQKSINNVVDASNFVLLELGHPSHTFDLATLKGDKLEIRHARAGESLLCLDEKTHKLVPTDLVVADAERAVSLAGVIGGRETGVTEQTTDLLVELATWDPATVRATARRLQISTDAGYRFERTVDARDLQRASDRLVELIIELAGGELVGASEADSIISVGADFAPENVVDLRTQRCRDILGIDIEDSRMQVLLETIGFTVEPGSAGVLRCTVPHNRAHEVTREIDLIEEVARLNGLEQIEVQPELPVQLTLRHPEQWHHRERVLELTGRTLAGLGFFETVTFSFLDRASADLFLPEGRVLLKVDDNRRREAPFLRPSIVPSLLTCRKANQDARAAAPGGVRLFEIASTFSDNPDGTTHERRRIAMLMDVDASLGSPKKPETRQLALRSLRASIENLLKSLGIDGSRAGVRAEAPALAALKGESAATVTVDGEVLGWMAILAGTCQKQWELHTPVAVAELDLKMLVDRFPPETNLDPLPAFPAIERDLSVIVEESRPWAEISSVVESSAVDLFEQVSFVGTFRGDQVGADKKSVTMRLRFRDPSRTLRHEEVDPQMATIVGNLEKQIGAGVRS
ncbi:MAG: phenylalanine--tRNA ligase subunit beta [Phycisphaerales bacterium]